MASHRRTAAALAEQNLDAGIKIRLGQRMNVAVQVIGVTLDSGREIQVEGLETQTERSLCSRPCYVAVVDVIEA